MAVPKRYEHIDFKPPQNVADQAKKGLEYRQKGGKGGLSSQEAGKEGIGSGVQRAVNLKNRNNLTPETIKMMRGFFARHEKNKSIAPKNKDTPWKDAGHVAWLLWGGDVGKKWVDKIIKQMEDADKKEEQEKKQKKDSSIRNVVSKHLQAKNVPNNEKLWEKVQKLTKGEIKTLTHNGKTINGPNNGTGFKKFPSAYCVPLHSEALTEKGWVTYDNLKIGDRILSYSFDRKGLVWSVVNNLHFFESAEVVRLTKQSLNLECTKDHRWVYTKWGEEDQVDHSRMQYIWGLIQSVKNGHKKVSHTIKGEFSPFQHWWERHRDTRTYEEMLSQTKFKRGWHLCPTDEMYLSSGGKILSSAPYLEPLGGSFSFENKYRGSWVSDILKMNLQQLETFFAGCIMCDGWQNKNKQTYGFSQKDKHHADAFELSAFLTGRRVRRSEKTYIADSYETPQVLNTFTVNSKNYYPMNGTVIEPVGDMPVWCPETSEGTWVMRQNGHITITGNSNGWASKIYKDLGGTWSKKGMATKVAQQFIARGKAKKDVGNGGLDEWFSGHGQGKGKSEGDATWGDWVAISPIKKTITKDNGDKKTYEPGDIVGPCGELSDDPNWKKETNNGKSPFKCMPRDKAHDMKKKERAELAKEKQKAEKGSKGKKPVNTPTFKKNDKKKAKVLELTDRLTPKQEKELDKLVRLINRGYVEQAFIQANMLGLSKHLNDKLTKSNRLRRVAMNNTNKLLTLFKKAIENEDSAFLNQAISLNQTLGLITTKSNPKLVDQVLDMISKGVLYSIEWVLYNDEHDDTEGLKQSKWRNFTQKGFLRINSEVWDSTTDRIEDKVHSTFDCVSVRCKLGFYGTHSEIDWTITVDPKCFGF